MASLLLAVCLGAAIDFIFAGLMVVLEQNVYAVMQIRRALTALLGAVIPLALMAWHRRSRAADRPAAGGRPDHHPRVETHRSRIDDVIADFYEDWDSDKGGNGDGGDDVASSQG